MPKRPDDVHRPWIVKRDSKNNQPKKTAGKDWGDMSSFYNSSRWRAIRNYFLKRNPLCVYCKSKDIIKPAEVIDHIVPIKQGGEMYSELNLQALCKRCHDKKSRSEQTTIIYNRYTMRR